MREVAGPAILRLLNGQSIVDRLFNVHPQKMSRAGIARVTGLSKPTVSALVADMESAGLLRVAHESIESPSIGRPAAFYELVPTVRHSVVADIGATKMLVGINDLFGNLVIERECETGNDASTALRRLNSVAKEMLGELNVFATGICVGVPGIYRRKRDRVEQALNLPGFEDLPLRELLAQHFNGHIHIENDVNLAALGELALMGDEHSDKHSDEHSKEDFAVISVGTGIGLGMVIGGNLYTGGTGSAGEAGSMLLSLPASDEQPLTLEDVASAPSIRKLLGHAIETGYPSSLDPSAKVADIFAAVQAGDQAASLIVNEVAEAMALAVSHVCLIADPTRVIFNGRVASNPIFVDAVQRHLARLIESPPLLEASKLGRRATLLGAVSMSLRSVRKSLVREILGD